MLYSGVPVCKEKLYYVCTVVLHVLPNNARKNRQYFIIQYTNQWLQQLHRLPRLKLFLICLVTDWMLDRDPQEEVFKAFRLFDDDDSGKISLRNLRRVARELGENMTDEELRAMIDEFDKDGDGESEFLCSLLTTFFSVGTYSWFALVF